MVTVSYSLLFCSLLVILVSRTYRARANSANMLARAPLGTRLQTEEVMIIVWGLSRH